MSTRTLHPLAEDYLDRLERAADHLPGARRRELVAEIEAHLAEALGPSPIDAEVAVELTRLGDPREIAEAESPRPAPKRPLWRRNWRPTPYLAVGVLIAGSLLSWVALLPGLVAVYFSRGWRARDRAIVVVLCVVAMLAIVAIVVPTTSRGHQYCGLRKCAPNSDLEIALALSTSLVPLIAAGLYTYWATRRYATTLRSGRPAA